MLWYLLLTLQRTIPLKLKMRFSQCIATMTNVQYLYLFATSEKTVSYVRNQYSIFQMIKSMIRYLFNIVLSFTTQIYCPWVLSFIAIGSSLMVLPRNLRRLGPSPSLQGKEIIHMIGTFNWKSIFVILDSTSSIA